MNKEILIFSEEQGQKRNDSTLSYIDCSIRLVDSSRSFEGMSNDDLDSLYRVAFGRWAHHLTRQAYIDALNKYRKEQEKKGEDYQDDSDSWSGGFAANH